MTYPKKDYLDYTMKQDVRDAIAAHNADDDAHDIGGRYDTITEVAKDYAYQCVMHELPAAIAAHSREEHPFKIEHAEQAIRNLVTEMLAEHMNAEHGPIARAVDRAIDGGETT